MGAFEDFVTLELPKRPWVDQDGQPGQVLMRVSDPQKRLGLTWGNIAGGGVTVSNDEGNAIKVGNDGGLYVAKTEWETTQW